MEEIIKELGLTTEQMTEALDLQWYLETFFLPSRYSDAWDWIMDFEGGEEMFWEKHVWSKVLGTTSKFVGGKK